MAQGIAAVTVGETDTPVNQCRVEWLHDKGVVSGKAEASG